MRELHEALPQIIAVVGATGTGKSELSLSLAEAMVGHGVRAEIINADAMQLYRGMNIGTAKLAPGARRGIPHHQLDVLDVTDEASVAVYQRRAREAAADVRSRGGVPILVGGSGLYVSAVLFDLTFPPKDADTRRRLDHELRSRGEGALHRRLAETDPAAAAAIAPRNHRRLVRALEVIELTGRPFTASLPGPDPIVPTRVIGLRLPRAERAHRLDQRVRDMWRTGMVDEVAHLAENGLRTSQTAARAIGYSQALAQLDGELSQGEAIEATQRATRRYAKRQEAWFGRYDATWLSASDPRHSAQAVATVIGPADD